MIGTRPAETVAEKMIKVDHAGENGAVNIYRGQHIVARILHRHLCEGLAEFQAHEEAHRAIFRQYLARNNIRRCVSYHLCGIGGFALGIVTGMIGPKAISATTYAVENVVLAHLAEQMMYLRLHDASALQCVSRIHDDEKAHHDSAKLQMGVPDRLTRILISVVRSSTESVIRFGMR